MTIVNMTVTTIRSHLCAAKPVGEHGFYELQCGAASRPIFGGQRHIMPAQTNMWRILAVLRVATHLVSADRPKGVADRLARD